MQKELLYIVRLLISPITRADCAPSQLLIPQNLLKLGIAASPIIVLEFYGETGIGGNDGEIFRPPKSWVLSQNYPNPFNPSTSISFDVPDTRASAQHVSLTVYDIRGRRAKALVDSSLEPGIHKVYWDGRDDQGVQVSSGVYLYVLRAGDETFTRKMIALK